MFSWFSNEAVSARNGVSGTLGMKEWFAVWALNLVSIIPVVGFIVYLIVFIKLGWGKDIAPSLANQVKLNLIISLVTLAIAVIVVSTCVAGGVALFSSLAR